jgi:hypothetical protein
VLPSEHLLRVPIDQFTRETHQPGHRRARRAQGFLLLPGLLVGALVWVVEPTLTQVVGSLLTATSIMTGFTFAMANTFWSKSIDARRDPKWAVDSQALDLIDNARTHMIWTVMVGVTATAMLLCYALFSTVSAASTPVPGLIDIGARVGTALIGALAIYLVVLVAAALRTFNQAVAVLKA